MDSGSSFAVGPEQYALNRGNPAGRWALTFVVAWGSAVATASIGGLLRRIPAMGIGAMILGWFAVVSIAYFRSPSLRELAGRIGLRAITGLQLWRIAAAGLFFWYGAHGWLPGEFVQRAAWGDLIAGLLGGVVCLWPSRGGYWLVHLFGLADLMLATATGMRMRLAGPAEMANIASFPVAMIPLFGVGLTAGTHLVSFDLLVRGKR